MAAPAAPAAGLHLTPSPTSSEPARAGSGRLYSTHSFPGSGVLSAGAGGGGKKRPGHLPRVDRAAPPDMAAPAAPALPPQRGRGRGGPRRPYKERRAGLPILLLRRGQGECGLRAELRGTGGPGLPPSRGLSLPESAVGPPASPPSLPARWGRGGPAWAGGMAALSARPRGPRPQVLSLGFLRPFPASGRPSREGLAAVGDRGLAGVGDDSFPVRATVLISRCSSQIMSDAPAGSAAVSRTLAGPGADCSLWLLPPKAEGAGRRETRCRGIRPGRRAVAGFAPPCPSLRQVGMHFPCPMCLLSMPAGHLFLGKDLHKFTHCSWVRWGKWERGTPAVGVPAT
ncbi:uncharacterized protein FN964_012144 isoform 1-T1 [Alca torda]